MPCEPISNPAAARPAIRLGCASGRDARPMGGGRPVVLPAEVTGDTEDGRGQPALLRQRRSVLGDARETVVEGDRDQSAR